MFERLDALSVKYRWHLLWVWIPFSIVVRFVFGGVIGSAVPLILCLVVSGLGFLHHAYERRTEDTSS